MLIAVNIEDVRTQDTYVPPETIPAPRFKLFDVVVLHWETEETKAVTNDVVQIVGMSWNPKHSNVEGWVCHVRNIYQPSEAHLKPGHQEDCFESDLMKIAPL